MRTPNGTAATTLFAGQAVARASFSFSVQRILRTPAYIIRLASAFALIACSAPVVEDPQAVVASVDMSEAHFRIYGGAEDDDADALPGVVALRIGMEGTFELCSGALIAANLVLTARHCVTRNLTSSVSCNENGKSSNGEHVAGDELPRNVGVYVGAAPRFGQHPDSIAKAIVSPPGPYLCDSDIALVVLDTPITSIEPLAVRRARPAAAGEIIRSVGYGQNDDKLPIGTRFRKDGVTVLAQGKAISASKTPLGLHEFEVGKSICQGDSGGPAISEETVRPSAWCRVAVTATKISGTFTRRRPASTNSSRRDLRWPGRLRRTSRATPR